MPQVKVRGFVEDRTSRELDWLAKRVSEMSPLCAESWPVPSADIEMAEYIYGEGGCWGVAGIQNGIRCRWRRTTKVGDLGQRPALEVQSLQEALG